MVKDPRDARMALAILFPFPWVNNHFVMDTEDFIPFITYKLLLKYLWPPLPGNIKSDIDRVILPCILLQPCNK